MKSIGAVHYAKQVAVIPVSIMLTLFCNLESLNLEENGCPSGTIPVCVKYDEYSCIQIRCVEVPNSAPPEARVL